MEYVFCVLLFQVMLVLAAITSLLSLASRRGTDKPSGNIELVFALLLVGLSLALALIHWWFVGTSSLKHVGMAVLGPALVLSLVLPHLRAALSRMKAS